MQYAVVVMAIVVLSSSVVGYILHKMNILNFHTLVATSAASILVSLIFPLMLNYFSTLPSIKIFMAFFISFILYTIMILVFTMLISFFVSERQANNIFKVLKGGVSFAFADPFIEKLSVQTYKFVDKAKSLVLNVSERINILEKSVDSKRNIDKIGIETTGDPTEIRSTEIADILAEAVPEIPEAIEDERAEEAEVIEAEIAEELEIVEDEIAEEPETEVLEAGTDEMAAEEELLVEEEMEVLKEELATAAEYAETQEIDEVVPEIPEAVEEILDKIPANDGISNTNYNSVNEYERIIEEAFHLKNIGDMEGAVTRYMNVLDANPPDDLAFGVVLDICAIYKSLGQAELAREILKSYTNSFSSIMSDSVMEEIEKNI